MFALVALLLIALGILVVASVVRTPPGHEAIVVRRGTVIRILTPGTSLVSPLRTRITTIDLRPRELTLRDEPVVAADSVKVFVDLKVRVVVADATKIARDWAARELALQTLALATLRIGARRYASSALLSSSQALLDDVQAGMDAGAHEWGVRTDGLSLSTRPVADASKPERSFRLA